MTLQRRLARLEAQRSTANNAAVERDAAAFLSAMRRLAKLSDERLAPDAAPPQRCVAALLRRGHPTVRAFLAENAGSVSPHMFAHPTSYE